MKSGKKNKRKMNHKKSVQKLKKIGGAQKNLCGVMGRGLKKVSLNQCVGDQTPVKFFLKKWSGDVESLFFRHGVRSSRVHG